MASVRKDLSRIAAIKSPRASCRAEARQILKIPASIEVFEGKNCFYSYVPRKMVPETAPARFSKEISSKYHPRVDLKEKRRSYSPEMREMSFYFREDLRQLRVEGEWLMWLRRWEAERADRERRNIGGKVHRT